VTNATGIGPALRRARLLRNKSIEEASRETRIRAEYLQAMERERFDDLLGEVYARGFLRTYAAYLGLDADKVIAVYAGGSGAVGVRSRTAPLTAPPASAAPARGGASIAERRGEPTSTTTFDPFAPAAAGAGTATAATAPPATAPPARDARRGPFRGGNPFRPSTAPPTFRRRRLNWPVMIGVAFAVLIVLATAGLFSRAKTVPPQANGAVVPPAGDAGAGVTLAVEGTIDVRMTVLTDGQVAYRRVLRAGEGESFHAESDIAITLGRGASAHLTVNGHDLGSPGSPERPFHAIYGPNDYRRHPSPGPSVG